MAGRRELPKLAEGTRLDLHAELKRFRDSDELALAFPPDLTNDERKYLHMQCPRMGLGMYGHWYGAL